MDIVQTFYDNMAPQYDKLFLDGDADALQVSKFDCEYRCVRRDELTKLLLDCGCSRVDWKSPEETEFYQPIVIAKE